VNIRLITSMIAKLTRRISGALASMIGIPSGILAYHRVAELEFDPQLLAVAPKHFAEQLQVLRDAYRPMALQDWVVSLQRGTLPPRAVAVTFDDGYADNLFNAKPILETYNVPATVFITAGRVGYSEEFWWDQLERLLLSPGDLPEEIDLDVNGTIMEIRLAETSQNTAGDRELHHSWNILQPDDPTLRHRAYRLLCKLFKTMDEDVRGGNLERMFSYSGCSRQARPTHRTLSELEVKNLAKGELVEVGAHTVTHPMLAKLSSEEQKAEILASKQILEDLLGRRVASFAYPYGTDTSYTADTVSIVREAGFGQACSNFSGRVWRLTDQYQLPRNVVRDWSGDEFARWLESWIVDRT
jgi:peptidoglycan/xylan/chitin deacetylase (PgdA/CDA1 family)